MKTTIQSNPKISLVQSPLNYTGGKFKLLPQIQALTPKRHDFFYDVFCGGANVGINTQAQQITCIDKNHLVIEILNLIKSSDYTQLITSLELQIEKFGLSDTYRNGYSYYNTDSGIGLSQVNYDAYLKLRSQYNQTKEPLLFLLLILFSFNNQIRFNKKGDFNIPAGKRDFNATMRKKLETFIIAAQTQNITFQEGDFRSLNPEVLKDKKAFLYLDPPYLIGTATYNEQNAWTQKDEIDLLSFLQACNSLGVNFALSNVTHHKGMVNQLLLDFIKENGLICHTLDKHYNNASYQRKNRECKTTEVLVVNF